MNGTVVLAILHDRPHVEGRQLPRSSQKLRLLSMADEMVFMNGSRVQKPISLPRQLTVDCAGRINHSTQDLETIDNYTHHLAEYQAKSYRSLGAERTYSV